MKTFKTFLFEKLRKNDKGETVPETCKKCGGKIVVALKGEPVFICKDYHLRGEEIHKIN